MKIPFTNLTPTPVSFVLAGGFFKNRWSFSRKKDGHSLEEYPALRLFPQQHFQSTATQRTIIAVVL